MKKNILILFVQQVLLAFSATAQINIEQYVKENQIAVKQLSPDSVNYSDLEPIGDAIGNARFVMLGEQDHGDAPTFLLKSRLIKYLHEKKGFNVLAFESDFFALNEGWDQVAKDSSSLYGFLRKNVTSVWTYCDACQPLFKNIITGYQQTPSPLMVTGFDNQQFLNYSYKYLRKKLDSVFRNRQLSIVNHSDYSTRFLPLIDTLSMIPFLPKPAEFYSNGSKLLENVLSEMLQKNPANDFWVMVVENLIKYSNEMLYLPKDSDKGRNERDIQMARNLRWIADVKYPGEKIIVWAQNFHISKSNGKYPDRIFNKLISMGGAFTADSLYEKSTYIIGFTSYEGTAGRVNSKIYELEKPGKNCFESWIDPAHAYAFVDFAKYNQLTNHDGKKFKMNGSVVNQIHTPYAASWTNIFDAVIFIRQMYPCKYVN